MSNNGIMMIRPLPFASAAFLHGLLLFSSSLPSQTHQEELTHHGRSYVVRLKQQSQAISRSILTVAAKKEESRQEIKATSIPEVHEALGEESSESGVEDLLSEYISEIRTHIEREKFYPRQARRLGHQGDLQLLLSINDEGEILEVSLLTSTTSRLLDRAGLEIFEKIVRFPPFPNDVSVSHIEVSIVLNYRM
jgi:periplasmic protein TonB